jgi:hypothetical protein
MSKFLLFLLVFSISIQGIAQKSLTLQGVNERNNYLTILGFQKDYLYKFYYQKVDDADALINGRDYVPYYNRSKSKPLLIDEKKSTGSLTFNGRKYNHLILDYDTYLDELIYSDSSKFINDVMFKIALNKEPVDGFSLFPGNDTLIFRHFRPGGTMKFNLPEGFYEVIYDGETKYIRKHQSLPLEKDGIYEYVYSAYDYILVGDDFSRITTTKSFIKLLGAKSNRVKKFMRINSVHLRKADNKEISIVMKYYDSQIMSEKTVK